MKKKMMNHEIMKLMGVMEVGRARSGNETADEVTDEASPEINNS